MGENGIYVPPCIGFLFSVAELTINWSVVLGAGDDLGVGGVGVGLAEPVAVFYVVTGVGFVHGLCLFGVNFLDELGRDTSPEFAVANLGVGENKSTGCDYRSTTYYGVVEHRCSHAHEGSILDFAAVKGDRVTDGDIVAKNAGGFAVEGVDAGVVLNVGAVANLYKMHVAANDGIEPYGAVIAHLYVTNYYRSFAEVAMLAEAGGRHAFESFYSGHFC